MKTSGIQLIAEFIGCRPDLLNDENQLSLALTEGIKNCGMHQVDITSHKFDPIGVTVISIINESHIAIHTYPEACHASIDIFHCSSESHSLFELLEHLRNELKPKSVKFIEILRGNKLGLNKDNPITSGLRYGFEVRYHFREKLYEKNQTLRK